MTTTVRAWLPIPHGNVWVFGIIPLASTFITISCITSKVMARRFLARVSSVRAPRDAADGLHGLNPRNTGRGLTLRASDAALMQRLRQGARERDGQERAHRPTASLMELGPTCTEAAAGWSGQTFTGHPAELMGARA